MWDSETQQEFDQVLNSLLRLVLHHYLEAPGVIVAELPAGIIAIRTLEKYGKVVIDVSGQGGVAASLVQDETTDDIVKAEMWAPKRRR